VLIDFRLPIFGSHPSPKAYSQELEAILPSPRPCVRFSSPPILFLPRIAIHRGSPKIAACFFPAFSARGRHQLWSFFFFFFLRTSELFFLFSPDLEARPVRRLGKKSSPPLSFRFLFHSLKLRPENTGVVLFFFLFPVPKMVNGADCSPFFFFGLFSEALGLADRMWIPLSFYARGLGLVLFFLGRPLPPSGASSPILPLFADRYLEVPPPHLEGRLRRCNPPPFFFKLFHGLGRRDRLFPWA